MKINPINNIKQIQNEDKNKTKKLGPTAKVNKIKGAIFEKSKLEAMGQVYKKPTIDQLKAESEKSFSKLKRMIDNMLNKQGIALNLSNSNDMINIDAATRAEASEMISDNGPYGVEAMSDTIVNFAIGISGGDKSKLDQLVKAIDKGFNQAGKALGGLPDISMKTYDRIMEKLDLWKNE